MKTKLNILLATVLLAASAQAVQITGSIQMSGTAALNNSLANATAVNQFSGVQVSGTPSGSFGPVTSGTTVTWTPFTWGNSTPPPPLLPVTLWSFNFNSLTYSFNLSNVSVVSQDSGTLQLLGSGTLFITGAQPPFDPTAGSWNFRINSSDNVKGAAAWTFTFNNSQTTAVPDGGMTAMLLGGALTMLGLVRRKLA